MYIYNVKIYSVIYYELYEYIIMVSNVQVHIAIVCSIIHINTNKFNVLEYLDIDKCKV